MSQSLSMSPAGAAIGALGNIGAALASNAVSYSSNKKLMKLQAALNYYYAHKTAINQPSWNRQGLEGAGYNPMLAVQNATSGSNSNWSGLNSVENPGLSDALSAGVANAQSFKHLENETQTTEANADLAYANADKAKAEKASLLEKLPFISQRERSEINNIDKDSLLKESQIHNIDETTRFIEKRFELDRMLGLMGIDTQRYGIDKSYNASTYATRINELNNIRTNRSLRGKIDVRLPFGAGYSAYRGAKNSDNDFYYDLY